MYIIVLELLKFQWHKSSNPVHSFSGFFVVTHITACVVYVLMLLSIPMHVWHRRLLCMIDVILHEIFLLVFFFHA